MLRRASSLAMTASVAICQASTAELRRSAAEVVVYLTMKSSFSITGVLSFVHTSSSFSCASGASGSGDSPRAALLKDPSSNLVKVVCASLKALPSFTTTTFLPRPSRLPPSSFAERKSRLSPVASSSGTSGAGAASKARRSGMPPRLLKGTAGSAYTNSSGSSSGVARSTTCPTNSLSSNSDGIASTTPDGSASRPRFWPTRGSRSAVLRARREASVACRPSGSCSGGGTSTLCTRGDICDSAARRTILPGPGTLVNDGAEGSVVLPSSLLCLRSSRACLRAATARGSGG
mmetsp:Transcript_2145/g.4912  ORF Transcript_2145/g.4912 Transcript_2145/m.4912 type:complete len:290 (-) Transcript_2145:1643-2512(-)